MTQPGAIYYLVLYAIIVVLQFFKVFPDTKQDPARVNWRNYFYVSLQVVYTSAGVAVLLFAQLKDWMPVIMMTYVFLVLISSYLDAAGTMFRENTRLAIHLFIIAFIVFATVISYQRILPKTTPPSMLHQYKVALPYVDNTFSRYVTPARMGSRMLYFSTSVEAPSRAEALLKGMNMAMGNVSGSIRPFKPSDKGGPFDVLVLSDQAVVEEEK